MTETNDPTMANATAAVAVNSNDPSRLLVDAIQDMRRELSALRLEMAMSGKPWNKRRCIDYGGVQLLIAVPS